MKNRALRWTVYVLVAALFALVCVYLANWQFTRNVERATQNATVERNYEAPAVPRSDVIGVGDRFNPDDEWRPVTMHGQYDESAQLLVRNRPHGGSSAFEVLTPFVSDDGSIFIVNRGWVPAGDNNLPDFVPEPPSGNVDVTVRLRPSEPLPRSGRTAPPGQVPTINLPAIAKTLDSSEVVTGAYGELISETPAAPQRPEGYERPSEDPGPHLSYAIQWILFAIMGFAFISYIIRTEVQNHREGKDHNAVRERRSRDRDGDEEDQLIDAASR